MPARAPLWLLLSVTTLIAGQVGTAQARERTRVAAGAVRRPTFLSALPRGLPVAFEAGALPRAPGVGVPVCRICGVGLPDAQLAANLRLGADSSGDHLRVYLKLHTPPAAPSREFEFAVDLNASSSMFVFGSRF